MWAPHQTPEPVEKIKKAQWSEENTRITQDVVNKLEQTWKANNHVTGIQNTDANISIEMAMKRFKQLDPKVRLPW